MTEIILNFFIFMIGGCAASFGNCLGYRIARKMNWVTGRSICNSCGRRLKVIELVPVFSCVILRAHCPKCKAYFGWSNCLTEAVLGAFCVVLTVTAVNLYERMRAVVFICLLGVVTLTVYQILDYRLHKIKK